MNEVVIRIKERINQDWTAWFDGLEIISSEAGGTQLSGQIIDQSSLYGLVARLRDLGLSITYLRCKGADSAAGDTKPCKHNRVQPREEF